MMVTAKNLRDGDHVRITDELVVNVKNYCGYNRLSLRPVNKDARKSSGGLFIYEDYPLNFELISTMPTTPGSVVSYEFQGETIYYCLGNKGFWSSTGGGFFDSQDFDTNDPTYKVVYDAGSNNG